MGQVQYNNINVLLYTRKDNIKCTNMLRLFIWFMFCNFDISEGTSYFWRTEMMKLNNNFEFEPGELSDSDFYINSNEAIDHASIPHKSLDQTRNQTHSAVRDIIKVKIVDEHNVVSHVMMRSLLVSTADPIAEVLYTSSTGNFMDDGKNLLKLSGMIYQSNSTVKKLSKPVLIYPIPVNEFTNTIYFSLPAVSFGHVTVSSLRMVLRPSGYSKKQKTKSVSITGDIIKHTWIPPASSYSSLAAYTVSAGTMVVSRNEFENIYLEMIPREDFSNIKCQKAVDMVVPLQEMILYLSKAGPSLLRFTDTGVWNVVENSVVFVDHPSVVCLDRITVSPPSFSQLIVVASSEQELFISSGLKQDKELRFQQIVDKEGLSVCGGAGLEKEKCKIIDHAFDTLGYHKLFVLVQDSSTSNYILVQYEGLPDHGNWRILRTISNFLPPVHDTEYEPMFIHAEEIYTDREFRITGMSTLTRPDSALYIWGTILLVYDIPSGLLGWIHSFLPHHQSLDQDDVAIQLSPANKKGNYAILTRDNTVWLGASDPFAQFYGQLIKQVNSSDKHYAVFFDNLDILCTLTFNAEGRRMLERKEIKMENSSSSSCDRHYDCPRMSLECESDSSIYHIKHTMYSRVRHFSVQPPLLLSKIEENRIAHPIHNKTTLVTYLTSMKKFFSGEKINEPRWWREERDQPGATVTDKVGNWWYLKDKTFQSYLRYLAITNLLPDNPMLYLSQDQYLHEVVQSTKKHEVLDVKSCDLPSVIYLDRNQEFRFNVSIEYALSDTCLVPNNLRLVVVLSDVSVVAISSFRSQLPFNVLYEVVITGKVTPHNPPGEYLSTAASSFYAWSPPAKYSDTPCCSTIHEGTAYERNMLVKVGCPPGRRLKFDSKRSLDILYSRGRTDDFECLYETNDGVPCFTTSEFAAAFYVEDLVTGEQSIFEGNYTLQVVAGGTGYIENVRNYSEEEIASFNYRPGDSKSQSLIWSLLHESAGDGMQDESTGHLIFEAKNPTGIVFECRIDSPCGNIPFGASNPGEFYLQIEVSNNGVDSSTNCDYTMKFMIHLIGIELSPRVHLYIMLVTLSILVVLAMSYYVCKFAGGYELFRRKILKKEKDESDSEEEFAEPPPQFRELLNRRMTLGGGVQAPGLPTNRRTSLFAHSLLIDAEREKAGIHNVKSSN